MSGRLRRIAGHVSWGAAAWIVPLALSVITVPALVRGLGIDAYGMYALAAIITAQPGILSPARALTRHLAVAWPHHPADARRLLASAVRIGAIVAFAAAALLMLAAGWIVDEILQVSPSIVPDARLAVRAASLATPFIILGQVYLACAPALGRSDIYAMLTGGLAAATSGGAAIIALLDGGLTGVFLWSALVAASVCVIARRWSWRALRAGPNTPTAAPDAAPLVIDAVPIDAGTVDVVPSATRDSGSTDAMLRGRLLRFAASSAAYQLWGMLLLLFERLWIARSLGPSAVAYHAVPMAATLCLHTGVMSLSLMLMPSASKVAHTPDAMRVLYRRACRAVAPIAVLGSTLFILHGGPLLTLWVGADFAMHAEPVLRWHAVTFGLMTLTIVPWQFLEAADRPSTNAWLSFALLAGTAPLLVWLTAVDGIAGAALARATVIAVALVPFVLAAERHLFGRAGGSWHIVLVLRLAAAIAAAVGLHLQLAWLDHTWPGLAASVALETLAFGAVLLATGYVAREERVILGDALRRLAARDGVRR